MAVDPISNAPQILPTALPSRATATSQATDATSLGNSIKTVPAAVLAPEPLTASQQAALAVNESLDTLNFVPPAAGNALLINETPPTLAATLESQLLSPVQQAALGVNELLQAIKPQPAEVTVPVQTATGGSPANPDITAPAAQPPADAATARPPIAPTTAGTNLTSPPPPETSPPGSTVTAARTEPSPATTADLNRPQPVLDRNPIAVPVYEIRDPKPAPAEPKPRRRMLLPTMPIGRVRPVDPLVLKKEWERRKETAERRATEDRPPLAERSIREMVVRANADLAASGLPLHLVLAKNDQGYCLEVYDCSDEASCRITQEVNLDLNQLMTILDNLQHETGIIININT